MRPDDDTALPDDLADDGFESLECPAGFRTIMDVRPVVEEGDFDMRLLPLA